MNNALKGLYTATLNNKVICFETNLKAFVEVFNNEVGSNYNRMYIRRKLAKSKNIEITYNSKKYTIQKLK